MGMDNGYISILNHGDTPLTSNNNVFFRDAINDDSERCYELSGCKRILSYLKQELGSDTPMLIDFSALPSSFDSNGRMADFITIFDLHGNSFIPIERIDEVYRMVYGTLGIKGENIGLYYKKEFYFAPKTSSYYYSENPKTFDGSITYLSKKNTWKKVVSDNVYFCNKSFSLSFQQFVDNLNKDDKSEYDCQQRNDILLDYYNKYFTNNKKGCLLSVPLIGFPGKASKETGGTFEGLGAIFVYFITKENKVDEKKIHKIANELWFLGLQITYNSMFQIAYELSRTARYESIKSAVAAIMSRNMSHNLGSHFISNTKNYFSALIDKEVDEVANYRGVRHALQYIQERMDFIATITSTDIYPYGVVNAKAQFFDELTPDDFGKRHYQKSYNFLLDYLVLSENISKQSWLGDRSSILSAGEKRMRLQIGHWNGTGEPEYWNSEENSEEENRKRDDILGINFAIPGGILGRHALFSIVENVIRNAAKHGQNRIQADFVIRFLYRTDEQRLIIFDNKEDEHIKGTVDGLKTRLKNLHFIKGVQLDQDNKGLKEMLICAIWLQNKNVAQVMTDNDMENDLDRKLSNIEKFLKVVAVNKDGIEINLNNESIGFLGYSINLNKYERVHFLKKEEIEGNLNNIKADVVCYHEDSQINGKKLSEIFPRFLKITEEERNELDDSQLLRLAVKNNCGNNAIRKNLVVSYAINYDNTKAISYDKWDGKCDAFLFKNHANKSRWDLFRTLFLTKGFEAKDKYVDAISGGDFTSTLVQPSFLNDEYNLNKIKESVATHFVIIDERIFEHYKSRITSVDLKDVKKGLEKIKTIYDGDELIKKEASFVFSTRQVLGPRIYQDHVQEIEQFVSDDKALMSFLEKDIEHHFLDRKGIHVFNLETCDNGFQMIDLSSNICSFSWGNSRFVYDSENGISAHQNNYVATFLSVHLGLIDKIRDLISKKYGENGEIVDKKIVESLKDFFGARFVSVHSGRGGFDIRESLREYAFINFSSIENPLYNSKYLLSQQFYNTKYHGKYNK